MKLDLPTLAEVARGAGFAGDAVPVAVAIAAGTSGGLTHYDHAVGIPGAGRYVGLWGVDVDRWPQYADVHLHEPHVAARAAYRLTQEHRGWGWSACYRSGWYTGFMDAAATAATRVPAMQRSEPPWTIDTATHTMRGALAGIHNLALDAQDRPTRMGQWWPTLTK